MRGLKIVLTILLCLWICTHQAGVASAQQQVEKSVEVTSVLKYLLYLPEGYEEGNKQQKWPLMIFLHGSGERGRDLNLVKKWGPPKRVEQGEEFPFILVSPQCPPNVRWNTNHLEQMLASIISELNVDESRLYLTGLSMGGSGTWSWAAHQPQRFAAIAPICGFGNPVTAEKLLDQPIWAFHGGDDKVVPPSGSQNIVDAIKLLGGTKVKLTVYEGVDHNSWTETYANPKLYEWFLDQKREAK